MEPCDWGMGTFYKTNRCTTHNARTRTQSWQELARSCSPSSARHVGCSAACAHATAAHTYTLPACTQHTIIPHTRNRERPHTVHSHHVHTWNGKWSGPRAGAALICTVPVSSASEMRMAWLMSRVNTQPCGTQNHVMILTCSYAGKTMIAGGFGAHSAMFERTVYAYMHAVAHVLDPLNPTHPSKCQQARCTYHHVSAPTQQTPPTGLSNRLMAHLKSNTRRQCSACAYLLCTAHTPPQRHNYLQRQVVGVAVCDRLIWPVHAHDRHHRPEWLLPCDAHGWRDMVQQARPDQVALPLPGG